jgi:hypothetical protein
MRIPLQTAAWIAIALLVGCASIGLAPAKSLPDRIAYAYGVNAGVRTAAANALEAGTLSIEDGEYTLKVTDESRTLLDTSRVALSAGDTQTAEGRLVLALDVLDALQKHLNTRVNR